MASSETPSNSELGKALARLLDGYVECRRGIVELIWTLREMDEKKFQAASDTVERAAKVNGYAAVDASWVAEARKVFSDLQNS